jgi:DNA primase
METVEMKFDFKDFLEKRGMKYVRINSEEIIIECPFCGKEEGHFYVNLLKNLYYCHKCHSSGSLQYLLIKAFNVKKDDAINLLRGNKFTGVSISELRDRMDYIKNKVVNDDRDLGALFFQNRLPKSTKISKKFFPKSLSERGIPCELFEKVGARFCNDSGKYFDRIIFPVETLKIKTFTAVTAWSKSKFSELKSEYRKRGIKLRKSLFPNNSSMSETLYMYNALCKKDKPLVIVEGVFDVLSLINKGFNAMGLFHSRISRRQMELLGETNAEFIYLMLDGDVPEDDILKQARNLAYFSNKQVRACFLPKDKDPDVLSLEETQKELNESVLINTRPNSLIKFIIRRNVNG